METFDSQLTRLAQQHTIETGEKLRPVQNPRRRPTSLQWLAIPAAAVFGLLIGLWLPFRFTVPAKDPNTIVVKHDTLYQKIVDTVIVEKETEKLVVQNRPAVGHDTSKKTTECRPPIEGKNIREDGIHYNMLFAFTK